MDEHNYRRKIKSKEIMDKLFTSKKDDSTQSNTQNSTQ